MRRITGIYDGVEHIILEYEHGIVECPSDLTAVLARPDHSLPTGDELVAQCRVLFGDTLQVREV
jgi:hypothetical protein